MGRFSPTVLPEVGWTTNPGDQIADALRNYAVQRRADERQSVEIAGMKQDQARQARRDPIEEALARLHAEKQGIVYQDPEAKPADIDPGMNAPHPAPSAPTDPGMTAPSTGQPPMDSDPGMTPPEARRAGGGWHQYGMPGAFDHQAGDFVPALPNASGREVAGLMAAGLLRAPVEAVTGQQGNPPAHQVVRPGAGQRRSLGGGYTYDPAIEQSFRQPDVNDLEPQIGPEMADYLSRHPEHAESYLSAVGSSRYAGRLTPKDLAQMQLQLAIAQGHDRAHIAAAGKSGNQNRDLTSAQREEQNALRDLQIIEGSDLARRRYQPGTPEFGRYHRATQRVQAAQQRVDALMSGARATNDDDSEDDDGSTPPPPSTPQYRSENPYRPKN